MPLCGIVGKSFSNAFVIAKSEKNEIPIINRRICKTWNISILLLNHNDVFDAANFLILQTASKSARALSDKCVLKYIEIRVASADAIMVATLNTSSRGFWILPLMNCNRVSESARNVVQTKMHLSSRADLERN